MTSSVDDLVHQLKAAGEATRIRLLALLAEGERSVKELTEILGQSQPRVSRHLKVLTDAGLVARAPEGSWVYYRLAESEGPSVALGILNGVDRSDPRLVRDRERLDILRRQNQEVAARFFAEHAEEWDRIRSLHLPDRDVEAAMLEIAGAGPFRAMLDVGTGTGRMLEVFADRYQRAIGLDLSPAMLAVARANLERAGIAHARVRAGDCMDLPVLRESFDLVVVHQVLHFLDEPARAIAEAASVLEPGGRLLVVDFAPHDLDFLRETQAHRRLGFASEQMTQWMVAAGLTPDGACDLQPPDGSEGLTVSLWSAKRDAESGRTILRSGESS